MKKLFICLILLMIFLIGTYGCLGPIQAISSIRRTGKTYLLGKTQTVNLGSPMFSIYCLYEIPAFRPKYEFHPPNAGTNKMPPLKPDQKWIARLQYRGNYLILSKEYSQWATIEIKPNGELGNNKAWVNLQNYPLVRMVQNDWKLPEPQLFIQTKGHLIEKKGSFKAELLYSGITGTTIIISYREYIDKMARSAFYQELRYDLEQSDEITFRTLKMKIIKANNQNITFKVLDDGGLPWMPKQ